MAGNSNSGGSRKGAGRKSHASKLLKAGFIAPWFTQEFQEIKWTKLVNSDDEKIVLETMKYISDQLHGKAKQAIEASGPEGSPIETRITVKFVDSGD